VSFGPGGRIADGRDIISAVWLLSKVPPTTTAPEIWQYPAMAMFLLAVLIQAVCFGLYRGWQWARLTAIALLVLSVPSYAFPAAVVGLFFLVPRRTWSDYVGLRKAPATTPAGAA
jgi:hypothetical protein